jgi:hypothetical protein
MPHKESVSLSGPGPPAPALPRRRWYECRGEGMCDDPLYLFQVTDLYR